ncbi:hypothetical protein [Bradyrhizobium sp.]|uniref:hypothetical protein n=1 Tax=Bradyrhizobium sp. TaxID=376 RepID=UPI003C5DED28
MSIADGDFNQMNALSDIHAAHHFASAIEDAEAKRLGVRISEARVSVARRLRTSPGTLENIRRLRAKIIPNWLMARIKAEFVSILQAEIARLEHEIAVCKQVGMHHSDDALCAAETQMAAAKEVLRTAR